jgi:hypothetical protein
MSRDAIRHEAGKTTLSAETVTQDSEKSADEPRDALGDVTGNPTPSVATFLSRTLTQESSNYPNLT